MLWENLTSAKHAEIDRSIPVVLPIASIEQHGPALPVCTDSLIGWHLCLELERRCSEALLILPQIKICYSQHHMDFPGSLTVSHESLLPYLTDIIHSIIFQGYQNVLLFNSHGGNQAIMQVVVEKLGNQHPGVNIMASSWWKLCLAELESLKESGFMGNGHAAEFEFSLVQYLQEELIDYEHKSAGAIAHMPLKQARSDLISGSSVSLLRTFQEITVDGTYGLTERASAEKGQKIFEVAIAGLEALVKDISILPSRT